MTGPNNKSPARVATIVLLTCAVLLAFGMIVEKLRTVKVIHLIRRIIMRRCINADAESFLE
ncbi:hypothetical protein LIPSTDRAFT_102801 [Lipomyces starkeyi NRRL Y-11557]|uniref:Uncharacterized protein n=1 Tax=Lipomyces starkeyi NRRL Y-11557 TaxID=675824 RepID=A0A1E3QC73_LIPST|nr:hypothetical protein LIPSTDRAFT_102801 [Lipomyces starkeyi NRRL Y-11557]